MVDKRGLFDGGGGEIRTLERLMTVTRFPIVQAIRQKSTYNIEYHSLAILVSVMLYIDKRINIAKNPLQDLLFYIA